MAIEMKKINQLLLTPAEMAQVDRASMAAGVAGIDLMEAAGRAVSDAVRQHWTRRPVVVLCGPGNNGGDGFVAARHLLESGWPVRLALLVPRAALKGDAAVNAARWCGDVEAFEPGILEHADIVIDAIFGAGLSHAINGAALTMIEAMATRRIAICAIDIPSGVDGATGAVLGAAAAAVVTVTFFRKKNGHVLFPGRSLCGKILLVDIGTPESALNNVVAKTWENAPLLWQDAYPWPQVDGHKYLRGHALVFGGESITGASRLTAAAATRVGAGVVTLAAPEKAWLIYSVALLGIIVKAIRSDAQTDDFAELLMDVRRNAIAIGPGAGVGDNTRRAVLAALATGRPTVLDADALTSFSDDPMRLFRAIKGPCVMTPHEGEFKRLFDFSGDKITRARRAAKLSGATILLKGGDTVIAEPMGHAYVNTNAPASLATAGSGDVLTGLVLGLLAQGLCPFRAAAAAAWLHGTVAAAFGPGLVAEDLHNGLPAVLLLLWQQRQMSYSSLSAAYQLPES